MDFPMSRFEKTAIIHSVWIVRNDEDFPEPGIFEVEFSDLNGRAYAIETLTSQQLLVLYHQPVTEKAVI
jgi:Domain of unknown function (DUF4926)